MRYNYAKQLSKYLVFSNEVYMSGEVILRVENLTKRFPGVVAVDHVSFELRKGEVHCLLGENGAGKSTFIKMISGAYAKDEGQIYYDGEPVEINSSHDAKNLKIATIYQEMNLVSTMNAVENIFLGEEIHIGQSKILNITEMKRQTKAVLDRLKVKMNLNAPVKNFSTAQQQMVEIAKSLLHKNKIIIMDEPTSSITEKDTQELFRIIRELKNEGVAIIYISHRLQELKEIVDRVTVLRDGKYIDTLEMKDVEIEKLITLMVGRSLETTEKRKRVISDEVILSVKNLSWKNKVKDVSFELKKGEILGFAGLVGAGRSELMKLIFGAERAESGSVSYKGEPVKFRNTVKAVRSGISYLSEDRKREGLVLNMPIAQNITLASIDEVIRNKKINLRKERAVAEQSVQELQVATTSVNKRAKFLSGGNQQKVVIGKWLLCDSEVFIFDEPTRGIDVGAKQEIYRIMEALSEQGKSVIMISSELPELLKMSDRIIVLSNGYLTGELENAEVVSQESIMKLMLEGF